MKILPAGCSSKQPVYCPIHSVLLVLPFSTSAIIENSVVRLIVGWSNADVLVFCFFSKDFIQILAQTTAKDAPVASPSFWHYHLWLHLKCTFVTTNFSNSFNRYISIAGVSALDLSSLRAMSMASKIGTLV